MPLFFNRAGPSRADKHYLIAPLQRMDMTHIRMLLEEENYFVLHAPRQTGKTTCLLALMDYLNQQGHYQALYANIENAQAAREHVQRGIDAVADAIAASAEVYLQDAFLSEWLAAHRQKYGAESLLRQLLQVWSMQSEQPVVLFLDEIDALVGDTLIAVLRQIRGGYAQRPAAFPSSIVLCGVRDVRDYRIHTRDKEIITGGSAFNIKATALRLGNLSESEIQALWQQHTTATGQIFDPAIYPELWADTRGQPWLVNALGYQLTRAPDMRRLWDRSVTITLEDYRTAREKLIQSRATHLDQLTDKLKEPRVHQVIATLLAGTGKPADIPTDDAQYVADLGLITLQPDICIANRIYQETIPRELSWTSQATITHQQHWYLTPERRLDMPRLLSAFQQFFREHSDAWIQQFEYKEAGPQLLLQAFLQRIVNGGGRISREYGLGRKRTDLYIEWPVDEQAGFHGEIQRIVLELKIRYGSLETTLADGLPQTADYAARCGADDRHLLIFDRRTEVSWDDKIWHQIKHQGRRTITVWGL
ncbi:MAG: AAA family ATPase [Pseudomonadota bacterium]